MAGGESRSSPMQPAHVSSISYPVSSQVARIRRSRTTTPSHGARSSRAEWAGVGMICAPMESAAAFARVSSAVSSRASSFGATCVAVESVGSVTQHGRDAGGVWKEAGEVT
eukprot:14369484-Alexandrium_andersonii.AAC.1